MGSERSPFGHVSTLFGLRERAPGCPSPWKYGPRLVPRMTSIGILCNLDVLLQENLNTANRVLSVPLGRMISRRQELSVRVDETRVESSKFAAWSPCVV
jgi:hypothetical protein